MLMENMREKQMDKENSQDKFEDVIRLGIKDYEPSRVTNWCKHIKVDYISTSPLGQMIRLPTLGMKRISCEYAKTTCESVSLDTAAWGFYEENCKNCAMHEEISWDNMFRMKSPVFHFLKKSKFTVLSFLNILWIYKEYMISILATFILYALLPIAIIEYSETVLATLAQVNSTIFALVFTIPLVASQLGRYRTPIPIFRGFSLVYMLLYMLAIFLPLSRFPPIIPVCIPLSVFCTLLLIPYFRWVENGLSVEGTLEYHKSEAVKSTLKNREASFREKVDNIYEIAVQALNFKDYNALAIALDELVELARYTYKVGFAVATEQKYGFLFIGLAIQRIGEMAVNDRFGLNIVSEKILALDTRAKPETNHILTLPLKSLEFVSLCVLSKLACDNKNWLSAISSVEALLEHNLGTFYTKHKELNDATQKRTIDFLITLPDQVIQDTFDDLKNKYEVKYGDGILKITLIARLAKLYLEYRKTRFPQRKMKKGRNKTNVSKEPT